MFVSLPWSCLFHRALASIIDTPAAADEAAEIAAEIAKLTAEKDQIDKQPAMKVDLSVVQRENAKLDPERRRLQAESAAIDAARQQLHSRWSCAGNVCPCGNRAACNADVANFNSRVGPYNAAMQALKAQATAIATEHGVNPELQSRRQLITQRIASLEARLAAIHSSRTMQAVTSGQSCIITKCQNLSGDDVKACWNNCWKEGPKATELPPVEAARRGGTQFFSIGKRSIGEQEEIKALKPRVQHETYRYRYPPPPGPIGPVPGQERTEQELQSK